MFAVAHRLSLVAAVACALPALAADPAPARLKMTASPPSLHLAEGSRSTLRVACPGEPPTLTPSVGRVEALREVASGVYEADYAPPDSVDPQIAFVTAQSPEGFGWVAIPLAGVRNVSVSARPRALVSVTVDGTTFGPLPADAHGRATVRVVVPPGVQTGTALGRKVDLDVEEFPVVHVVASPASLDANAAGEVTVRALVVTERGAPRARAPVTFTVSEGALAGQTEIEPGVVQVRWKVAPGKVREAKVTARLGGARGPVGSALLQRVAGPARSVTIAVDREQLVAGDGDELQVTARIADQAGNPADAPAALWASPGTVLTWERAGAGLYEGTVQVPRRRAGRQELELRVTAARTIVATRAVPLLAGPPRQLRVELADGDARADGGRHALRVVLLDANDNHVDADAPPAVTARRGDLGTPSRYAPGAWRVDYRAPIAEGDFEDVVQARVGDLSGTSNLRLRGVGGGLVLGAKGGFTFGTGQIRRPSGGIEVGLWTTALGPNLGLVLEGRYVGFSRSSVVGAPGSPLTVASDVGFYGVLASVAMRRPLLSGMLWLGAGGGAVWEASSVGATGQPAVSARVWVPEGHASVGWGHRLGPGIPFAEVLGSWQAAPSRGPVSGSFFSASFNVGYRLDVF